MNKIVAIFMAMLMVMSVTVVLASGVADKDTQPKVRVIIGFKDMPSQADKDTIRGHGGDIKYSYTIINAIAAKLPEQAIAKIEKNPRVAYVEMDAKMYALGQTLPWGVDRIDADLVHTSNKGTGVKVAIIDTGIDHTHPDLSDNYKGGIGYKEGVEIGSMDDNGHGTHCAGIVAAVDNEEGVIGVAPAAYLYAVKVLNQYDDGYYGYYSDIAAGIAWAVTNDMQVISMSLGGSFDSTALHEACDAAYDAGIVVVAAAGNSGNPPGRGDNVGYPARYSSVIAVAATDINDNRASWSSTGPDVELAAPGVGIDSTVLGGDYDTKSGTSMACPHVAGTAALVIASGITDGNGNDRVNDEVRERLQETADDLGAAGRDTKYGYGLVDADEAASQLDITPPVITNVITSAITSNSATITWDTDELSDSLVKYGTTSGEYTMQAYDTDDITAHSIVLTGLSPDTIYYYVVNSTDPSDNSEESAEYSFTTREASSNTMHVASINMLSDNRRAGRNTFVWAVATVTIFDDSGNLVEGATVSGHWSDATSNSDSGVTDASGQVLLESDSVKNPPSGTTFTFTIDGVTHADLTWDGEPASGSITV